MNMSYITPAVKVIAVHASRVLCESTGNTTNEGYKEEKFDWDN